MTFFICSDIATFEIIMNLYPANILEVTEFEQIRTLLKEQCYSFWARKQADKLLPISNKGKIAKWQNQAFEYKKIIGSKVVTPEIAVKDNRYYLKLLEKEGSVLDLQQVVDILDSVSFYTQWNKWYKEREAEYPELYQIFPKIDSLKEIATIIKAVIDDKGKVKDNATDVLQYTRESISDVRKKIATTFERELRKAKKNKQLSDTGESYLNQRRVLAILAEYKRQVPGIIHGESETHKTVYIEPQNTIPLNAELENLLSEERAEIRRILKSLSAELAEYRDVLYSVGLSQYILDFIRAKAHLAHRMDATRIHISTHAIVHLQEAYHPLLKMQNEDIGETTVPIDIDITQQHKIVVISGPNAGGKTVSLKTVMLLQIMFQSGLLIPADHESSLGIFSEIFAQIGDAQSIDLKLSTYSAHLENMKYLLSVASARTLFCIDELGSGSDPHLGGVFAEVILERLSETGAKGIVTTHYLNLKTLAEKNPNMVNAAMVFDEENLQPLFKFAVGKPGSSYTFSIAERVGIEKEIIDSAKELVQDEHYQLEHLLRETEKRMQSIVKKEEDLAKMEAKYSRELERYKSLSDKEEFRRQEKMQKLQNQIKQQEISEYKNLERKLRQLIQDWKKAENKEEVLKEADTLLSIQKIKKSNKQLESKANRKYRPSKEEIKVGSLVKNVENAQVGTVQSIDNKEAKVKIGNLLFTMQLSKLEPVELRPQKPRKNKQKKKKD